MDFPRVWKQSLVIEFTCHSTCVSCVTIHNSTACILPRFTWNLPQFLLSVLEVPSQVTGLSLSKAVSMRSPALRATWTIPQSDEPISQYILQYRKHGTASWGSQRTIYPPQNSTIVPLAAGTEYDVRVRAVSAVGAGNWSAVQTERTYMSEFL